MDVPNDRVAVSFFDAPEAPGNLSVLDEFAFNMH